MTLPIHLMTFEDFGIIDFFVQESERDSLKCNQAAIGDKFPVTLTNNSIYVVVIK